MIYEYDMSLNIRNLPPEIEEGCEYKMWKDDITGVFKIETDDIYSLNLFSFSIKKRPN